MGWLARRRPGSSASSTRPAQDSPRPKPRAPGCAPPATIAAEPAPAPRPTIPPSASWTPLSARCSPARRGGGRLRRLVRPPPPRQPDRARGCSPWTYPVTKPTRAALYARVSTSGHGQDVGLQLDELRQVDTQSGREPVAYVDKGVSSSKDCRPALDRLMDGASAGRLNLAALWHFERFARDTAHMLAAMKEFMALGVHFVSLREQVDTSTPMGKAMFTIISAISELERDLIRERVVVGVRRAQPAGKHRGRPRHAAGAGFAPRGAVIEGGERDPQGEPRDAPATAARDRGVAATGGRGGRRYVGEPDWFLYGGGVCGCRRAATSRRAGAGRVQKAGTEGWPEADGCEPGPGPVDWEARLPLRAPHSRCSNRSRWRQRGIPRGRQGDASSSGRRRRVV